jgi:hypothetical protein
MAVVNKTIGIDARDYSTITLWEANDGGGDGLGNDDCTGSCYNDSVFDESVVINFSANSIVLTVAAGEQHDGTAGTGARIGRSAVAGSAITVDDVADTTVEWLEIYSVDTTPLYGGLATDGVLTGGTTVVVQRMILRDIGYTTFTGLGIGIQGDNAGQAISVHDNILYNIFSEDTGADGVQGIYCNVGAGAYTVQNNTIHACTNDNGTGSAYGIVASDVASLTCRNNIVTDTGGTTSGETTCFEPADTEYSNATVSHNLSSDATAPDDSDPGTAVHNAASGDQFISTSPVNLHLKTGADAIDAGTDLGTTPSGVEVDIDGRDRDAEGDTWGMGADEYVAVGVRAREAPIIGGGMLGV